MSNATNGGTGYVKRFIDGKELSRAKVTWPKRTIPRTQWDFSQLFSVIDLDARFLMLGCGNGFPMQVDRVMVCK